MKKLQRFYRIGLLLLVSFAFSTMQAQSYAKLWQQMEQAQEKGLPKTMIQVADRIVKKAEREQNAPQLLKATVWGEAIQSRLTPDSLYAGIRHLEAWAVTEPNSVNRAILHSLLATRYADQVWKANRYGTELEVEEVPDDMREWTPRLFAQKMDECCRVSVVDKEALLKASAKDYQPFVILNEGSRFYAHDLYHLLAQRALDCYAKVSGFLPDSVRYEAMSHLYRQLSEVYANRPESKEAALLTALQWIQFQRDEAYRTSLPQNRMEVEQAAGRHYLQQLDSLIARYGSYEVCAEAYISKASWLRTFYGASRTACLQTCDEGLKRYPKYKRINELKNIREDVMQPYLTARFEGKSYPDDSLQVNVYYQNIQGFMLNVYRTSFAELPNLKHPIDAAYIRQHGQLVSSTHRSLVPTPKVGYSVEDWNYLRSDTLMQVSAPHELGVYILQMVPDGGKAEMVADFFVLSRLHTMTLQLSDEQTELVVLDAKSGHPVAGAEVVAYSNSYGDKEAKVLQQLTTNAEGKAVFTQKDIRAYTVRKEKDTAFPRQYVWNSSLVRNRQDKVENRLTLLTDRSTYRPGQTVYVKGVAYQQEGWKTQVLDNAEYEVVLFDANHQEVAARKVRTNDFGSFTAELVLPSACLNGMFTVQTRDRRAVVGIRVEEYKRPTFEIHFTPIPEAYCLGEQVVLKGNVKAFSGRSVQEVPLTYTLHRTNRVQREEYEEWLGRQTLKTDTVQLDAEGNFEIPIPLPDVDAKVRYRYLYEVEAVVTDESGETQQAVYTFGAHRNRYEISLGLPSQVCKDDSLHSIVSVQNAAGVKQAVEGTLYLYASEGDVPVWKGQFRANESCDFSAWSQLPSGEYRMQAVVTDSLGRTQSCYDSLKKAPKLLLFSKTDRRLPVFTDEFCFIEHFEFDEHQPAVWYYGTSHRDAYVLMDVFAQGKRVESKVLNLSDSLMKMEFPYRAAYGKEASILLTFVKDGRVYERRINLQKKRSDRALRLQWEVFRDRLLPGQEEEWKLTVKSPDGQPVAAEMLAMLYDASLDQLYPHRQMLQVHDAYPYYSINRRWAESPAMNLFVDFPRVSHRVPRWSYDRFFTPASLVEVLEIVEDDAEVEYTARPAFKASSKSTVVGSVKQSALQSNRVMSDVVFEEEMIPLNEPQVMLEPLSGIRKNFAETAFFYPQLRTNEQGDIVFAFTMPQSLTRWNFRGYAHTKDMMTGLLDAQTVTAKEFMIQPNMPRFVRVGDRTTIAATVSNLSNKVVKGTARLTLFDPMTEKVLLTRRQKFAVEAGRNAAVKFDFEADERYSLLGVRIVAEGGSFSDGEQRLLPVLSNRVFVTESLPVTVKGGSQKEVSLETLFNGRSTSATHRRLTVEFTGNPAWYAVQALPSLSIPTSDNATDYATAFYANTLAAYIAGSQPRIQAMVQQWKQNGGTADSFMSQLEKNQELKNILLSESPWVLEATSEAEQRARIATLFDLNQLKNRNYAALTKLRELQHNDGSWSWYKGMPANETMTAYITELLVRLPLLTGEALDAEGLSVRQKAFGYLHQRMWDAYREAKKAEKRGEKFTTPSASALQYLYLIALSNEKVPDDYGKAYRYWLDKVAGCLEGGSIKQKSQAAIVLWQANRKQQAQEFVASLREHLIQEEEMGAHFAFLDESIAWGMMPIPVHVAAMEAFQWVGGQETLMEEMKLWLLKQKQTTGWTSPVATADAVYALLCQGRNFLADAGDVRIAIGNRTLHTTDASEAMKGFNYIKETFTEGSSELKASSLKVENQGEGMSWGAVYAQYYVPLNEVQQQGGALSIRKQLFVERVDANGHKTLQPLGEGEALKVGDKVVSRLTMKLDRAMDFVQLKDQRAACFEPLSATSGYRWMNGVGCYVEIEDAATNFFFDRLGKGVYVLENACRMVREGTYEAGIATVQSAYAPEFSAHSSGATVVCE